MTAKIGEINIVNFKKIERLDVPANGGNVIIMGKNGTGKTTLIQALYSLLTGKELPPDPVTMGQREGSISASIIDDKTKKLLATANLDFSMKDPKGKLTVLKPDGEPVQGGGRTFLDSLCSGILFDPFDFIKKKSKDQVEFLKGIMGVNFDKLDADHAEVYEKRKDVNAEIKNLKGELNNSDLQPHELKIFIKEKDIEELTKIIRDSDKKNKERQVKQTELTAMKKDHDDKNDLKTTMNAKLYALKDLVKDYEPCKNGLLEMLNAASVPVLTESVDASGVKDCIKGIEKFMESIYTGILSFEDTIEKNDTAIGELKDKISEIDNYLLMNKEISLVDLNKQFQDATEFNKKVEQVTGYKNKLLIIDEKEQLSKSMTGRLNEIKDEKLRILSEKGMPVPGLGIDFENECLIYEGLKFDETQMSKSRIIAIGIEIMMSTNPTLKICRIKDGSLLDDETMAELVNVINQQDFQAFIEIVDKSEKGLKVVVQEV